ncbi:MAG: copper resistance protein CopC, partial [Actinomycetota bacterium]|nr:copper resistance protein CopC [Actinomycetota bacterium]
MRRRLACLVAALLCALVAGLWSPASAEAHAEFVSSSPADGAFLASAPRQVTIVLSEPVERRFTTVRITAGSGRRIAARDIRVVGGRKVVVALPPLPPDSYRVAWLTLSSHDLHRTSGVLVFGVGRPANALGTGSRAEPAPAPLEVAFRWLGFLALGSMFGAGTLFLLLRAGPAAEVRRLRMRLARVAAAGGGLALLSGVGQLLTQAGATGRAAVPAAWHLVTATAYGPRWALGEAAVAALLAVALMVGQRVQGGRPPPDRRVLAAVIGPAVLAIGV